MRITAYIQNEYNSTVLLFPLDDDPILIDIALAIPPLREMDDFADLPDEEFDRCIDIECFIDEVFPYTENIGNWAISELRAMGYDVSFWEEVQMSNDHSDDIDVIVY